jgi:NAD(P)-dependent dehydrogenase (short-subunit alcohol dehydrogenase family)
MTSAPSAGSIVNVSSGISFSALPGTGAYSASKAGLNQLSAVTQAGAILDLIKTGAEQADLVPEQFGGSFKG